MLPVYRVKGRKESSRSTKSLLQSKTDSPLGYDCREREVKVGLQLGSQFYHKMKLVGKNLVSFERRADCEVV